MSTFPQFPTIIPTKSFTLSDVPNESDNWHVIGRFALSFHPSEDDPYKLNWRDLPALSADSGVVRLRAHLFLEQRRWNHMGREPDTSTMTAALNLPNAIPSLENLRNDECR
ncbi:hypothetical protein [Bradyrhizobium sp. Ce-3]|uniref:hypothetical protein n=1 Tax=Bradyrhizobium sp. Ce-3 TaxID=2913970 RepID=UPI001FC80354|nr:hypothetical protein [Bradyrhizobium sp. Ce-3]GKQ52861.1 hypothetical protein BRSPCE3_37160 [Bradyrhizobium sp. Ce-3]